MIAVAAVGVAMGGVIELERSRRVYVRHGEASRYAAQEKYWSNKSRAYAEDPDLINANPVWAQEQAIVCLKGARYFAALRQIYLRAAEHPWEPVPPLPSIYDF
jgi:hypothetical protein